MASKAFRRRYRFKDRPVDDVPEIVVLWLLRMLVPLGAHRHFIGENGFQSDAVAKAVGLGQWLDLESHAAETEKHAFRELFEVESPDRSPNFEPRVVLNALRRQHVAAERKLSHAAPPAILQKNIDRLAPLVGLSPSDACILAFAVVSHHDGLLDDVFGWVGDLSSARLFRVLAVMLGMSEQEVRTSLSPHGVLARSGLVTVDRNGMSNLRQKINLLSEHFGDQIFSTDADPMALLRDTVHPARPPKLSIGDYEHLARALAILRPFLRQACATGRRGVNIFLHGAPGTGKSELARVLAAEVGCELFEVAGEDSDGDPVKGDRRLRAYRAAQSFFAQQRALIVFDEAEDVFNDGGGFFGVKSTAQTRKGWVNRMLEENPVPALWLSNSIHDMDPAFVRRFDMMIEVSVPPRRQRERIIGSACGELLDAAAVSRLAETEHLAPAVVARAASVVQAVSDELGAAASAITVEQLIAATLQAQGHRLPRADASVLATGSYDPAFIQADADLAGIAAGLVRTRAGRLCLVGPPGSGKTAFGKWLAGEVGAPLHALRASDLMGMYVGETEKNIAQAFRKAERDGALLMIDEVGSFLQDRRGAHRSWEVSQVNEMLTQMESFAGIFIASTNLMDGLDPASLRRFDLKVRFDFLNRQQAWQLFARTCVALELAAPVPALRGRIEGLTKLTPGDFAAVSRQHRFRTIDSAVVLAAALAAECEIKQGAKSAIGFL